MSQQQQHHQQQRSHSSTTRPSAISSGDHYPMPSKTSVPLRRSSRSASPTTATTTNSANTSWMNRLRSAANQMTGKKSDDNNPSDTHYYASHRGMPSSSASIAGTSKRRQSMEDVPSMSNEQNSTNWPIFMLVIPPIGSLFIGTAQDWSDSIALVLIGLYLYHLVKVPWELYYAAQTDAAMRNSATSIHATPDQRRALARLKQQERLSLAMVLLAPLLGGFILHLAKSYLVIAQYLTPSHIMLYVIVVSIRPINHLIHILQGRAVELHRDITWRDTDAAQLRRRLDQLELSLRELRLACATEDDIDMLKEEVHTVLDQIARGSRHHARREQKELNLSANRIDAAEERVREVEEWCERQRARQSHSMIVRFVWEPVCLFRDAIGVAGVPLLGFGGLIGGGSSSANSNKSAKNMNTAKSSYGTHGNIHHEHLNDKLPRQ
ncbi:hypothetical protein BDF22DRAFT_670966 [Syncephalis plumigaleata]|nr:hypothetical protein BDF22DRAFT_670966 [Syncephalis plumigaleata]